MTDFLTDYARLILNLYRCRKPFAGIREFSYRIMAGLPGRYRVYIHSNDSAFSAMVLLRRDTTDLATFVQIFGEKSYDLRRLSTRWPDIVNIYDAIADNGVPLILDLGANIGLASLYFAKNWPAAHIIAVEPDPRNYHTLSANVAEVRNIRPFHAAVASEDGYVQIANPEAEAWAIRTEMTSDRTPSSVVAMSVPSLLAATPANNIPFMVKIDIEGFEADLFSRNTDWVDLFPILIIELHDWLLPGKRVATNFLREIAHRDRDFIPLGENIISMSNPRGEAMRASACGGNAHAL